MNGTGLKINGGGVVFLKLPVVELLGADVAFARKPLVAAAGLGPNKVEVPVGFVTVDPRPVLVGNNVGAAGDNLLLLITGTALGGVLAGDSAGIGVVDPD